MGYIDMENAYYKFNDKGFSKFLFEFKPLGGKYGDLANDAWNDRSKFKSYKQFLKVLRDNHADLKVKELANEFFVEFCEQM